jgi:5-formyltetrahydrofolate cyclo-ligase
VDSIHTLKEELRRQARARVREMSSDAREQASRAACDLFLAQRIFAEARSVLLYMPLRDEVDVRLIMERATSGGKFVALPRFLPETGNYGACFVGDEPLVAGPFGAFEPSPSNPVPLNQLDLIVVPGVAFDLRGRRLGRGKGFYDRLLSATSGVKCGICFEEQLLPEIPVEPHDLGVDFLATPTRWVDCRGSTPEKK